jgi:hypothetical protein
MGSKDMKWQGGEKHNTLLFHTGAIHIRGSLRREQMKEDHNCYAASSLLTKV